MVNVIWLVLSSRRLKVLGVSGQRKGGEGERENDEEGGGGINQKTFSFKKVTNVYLLCCLSRAKYFGFTCGRI